jgi:hypothetical protein
VKEMDSHRVPLGISFFHPCGLSASTTATYFHQDGQFLRFLDTGFVELDDATDDFWTIDAAATYRLPKRYGFVTFGATNLFDEEFSYFDTDLRNPSIQPDRMLFGRVTLVLP